MADGGGVKDGQNVRPIIQALTSAGAFGFLRL
jgi:hypothetical protein